mmetsp:Transcript_17972/g.29988  ORF Transcript_17972/g.29988 Transcript_17972/m.29988 type:complete len:267 (+) Transcript_17972:629-1429(+)
MSTSMDKCGRGAFSAAPVVSGTPSPASDGPPAAPSALDDTGVGASFESSSGAFALPPSASCTTPTPAVGVLSAPDDTGARASAVPATAGGAYSTWLNTHLLTTSSIDASYLRTASMFSGVKTGGSPTFLLSSCTTIRTLASLSLMTTHSTCLVAKAVCLSTLRSTRASFSASLTTTSSPLIAASPASPVPRVIEKVELPRFELHAAHILLPAQSTSQIVARSKPTSSSSFVVMSLSVRCIIELSGSDDDESCASCGSCSTRSLALS